MRKFLYFLFSGIAIFTCYAANKSNFYLHGKVKTAITNQDLTNAYVLLYDSAGNVTDSIRTNAGLRWRGSGEIDTMSYFSFPVPRVDSMFVFDVVCEGFKPKTVMYELSNIKKNETGREIPIIFMERAPIKLKEVSVTATKIKFYNKGDTTVYDASAFELAEGSMLDALIAQLPGAELSTDGQIKVNGVLVESLLLDGKQFFDGNNNLMLENIAAYTVKDIQVYEGEKKEDVQMGRKGNKILTMDVRLKKEYNIGWILNLQGGYGTDDRYIGRAFISWFNPRWRVSLIGNVNNLNDNRQPGRNDTWTPDMLPSGKKEYRNAGIDYNYENPDETTSANGSLMFQQTINNVELYSDRINFLEGGDTYDRSFGSANDKETRVRTSHSIYQKLKNMSIGIYASGGYRHEKNSNSNLSGSFNQDPGELNRSMLEAIYSDGTSERLESIINRSATKTDSWNKNIGLNVTPYFHFKLPSSVGGLTANLDFGFQRTKEELWKDYEINYGPGPDFSEKLRQFFDNKPNIERTLGAEVGYNLSLNSLHLSIRYSFQHKNNVKDSYMYALDRLNDMGVYGVLPSNYLMAFDPQNSYTSHHWENTHFIRPEIQYYSPLNNGNVFSFYIMGNIGFVSRRFDYWRNNEDFRLNTFNTRISLPHMYSARIMYYLGKYGENRNTNYRHSLSYSYILDPTLPNLFDMVDVVNDSEPLNIYYGNPDLKMSVRHRHQVWWFYKPQSITFRNEFSVSYTWTHNEQTRGYVYDTSTGVRHNRMYNINGNHNFAVSDNVEWQFGRTKQFTLTYTIDAGFAQATDMIGVNTEAPELYRVHTASANQRFKLTWQLGKQNIGLRLDAVNRHTTSSQVGFNTLDAHHINAGVQGVFVMPAGFGISTDFMCYTRRGYGTANLDTTDPVWNIRLSYAPPRNKHWVFMVDGFDMLHKLSNINYAVTASGRTISYTNMIPRYIMLSVQYRLNIQPKKK